MPVKYKLGSGDTVDITAITKTNQGAGSGLDADKVDGREPGQANGLATLDAGSKVPSAQLPLLALTDVWVVASQAEQLALTAEEGDVAIRTDQNRSYIHNGGTAGTMANWSELLTPTDTVLSVFGRVGAVVAAINDYTWAQINKATSSIADITTRSHILLTDIGTNTHAQIDTGLPEKGEGHIVILPGYYNAITAGTWIHIYQGAGNQDPDWTFRNSSLANLDQIDYKVYLAPGTYTFAFLTMTNTDRGIVDVLIDGTSAGTLDIYSASLVFNVRKTLTGIVVSIGGLKTLSIKVNGKHASSTGYLIDISSMALWRTA